MNESFDRMFYLNSDNFKISDPRERNPPVTSSKYKSGTTRYLEKRFEKSHRKGFDTPTRLIPVLRCAVKL